jgi:hypothetical protein
MFDITFAKIVKINAHKYLGAIFSERPKSMFQIYPVSIFPNCKIGLLTAKLAYYQISRSSHNKSVLITQTHDAICRKQDELCISVDAGFDSVQLATMKSEKSISQMEKLTPVQLGQKWKST